MEERAGPTFKEVHMSHSHVLERLAPDLKMAGRVLGTRQQHLASLHRFEERIGESADQATQEEVRGWAEFLQTQPIGSREPLPTIASARS